LGLEIVNADLRNPIQQTEEVKSKNGAIINNIYNYGAGTQTRFNFASIFATIVVVVILIIVGVLIWKADVIEHLIDTFRSMI
jgi:hypothetical protein